MSAGERYKNGRPKDIVRHYETFTSGKTLCGRKNPSYATQDWTDVTCLKCLDKRHPHFTN